MLLPSRSHTAADLAAWDAAEQTDALHARIRDLPGMAARARRSVEEFAAAGGCYLSTSWGKDSVVVAHLAHGLGLPLLHLHTTHPGRRPDPDSALVRDIYLRDHPARYVELWVPDPVSDQLALIPTVLPGFGRRVTGVRAAESGVRDTSARVHGVATARTCRPILRWSTADVFAYLYVHGLPVHPAYAMTGGGAWPRDTVRVHHLGTSLGAMQGRQAWEDRYYPPPLDMPTAESKVGGVRQTNGSETKT